MRIYNVYVLIVSALLMLTTVILVALGQSSLAVYYSSYIIEALVVTEMFAYFIPKARRGLNLVSATLFGGFMVVICLQII